MHTMCDVYSLPNVTAVLSAVSCKNKKETTSFKKKCYKNKADIYGIDWIGNIENHFVPEVEVIIRKRKEK